MDKQLKLNKVFLNIKNTVITFESYWENIPATILIKIKNDFLKTVESFKYLEFVLTIAV